MTLPRVMTVTILSLSVMLGAACGDGDKDSPADGGGSGGNGGSASGTGGGGGASASGNYCMKGCALSAMLNCPNDVASTCMSDCQSAVALIAALAPNCVPQVEAALTCVANRPLSDWECDAEGEAGARDGVCAAEEAAVQACAGS
jgi:hypothetical protein